MRCGIVNVAFCVLLCDVSFASRIEDAASQNAPPSTKLNPWLRKYRDRVLKEGLEQRQHNTKLNVNAPLPGAGQFINQNRDALDTYYKNSDPVVDTHDGVDVDKTKQQNNDNTLTNTDVKLNDKAKLENNAPVILTKDGERFDNKQENEHHFIKDKQQVRHDNEPRHDDEKATDREFTHKTLNDAGTEDVSKTKLLDIKYNKNDGNDKADNFNSTHKDTKPNASKLNTIQPKPIPEENTSHITFPQINEPSSDGASSIVNMDSSSQAYENKSALDQHVLEATDYTLHDTTHQNKSGSTNRPMRLYTTGFVTDKTSSKTPLGKPRSGQIKQMHHALGAKSAVKQKHILQDGIGIKEEQTKPTVPNRTGVHVSSEAKYNLEINGDKSDVKSGPNKLKPEYIVASRESDKQIVKSDVDHAELNSDFKIGQDFGAEINNSNNIDAYSNFGGPEEGHAIDVAPIPEVTSTKVHSQRHDVQVTSSTFKRHRPTATQDKDGENTTVLTPSTQHTVTTTKFHFRPSDTTTTEQIIPTSDKPAEADVNIEPDLNPIDAYMCSGGGYSGAALVSGVVGGMGMGGGLVLLALYCKRRCSRLVQGDYRPVPMQYDFELNPRFKNT